MQEKFYKKRIKEVDKLRSRFLVAWDETGSARYGSHAMMHASSYVLNADTSNEN